RRTWRAMDFRHGFCLDRWQARPALGESASRRQRISAMLEFANGYRGAEYVWGGAGRPRFGVDCSGLVLQALYRAGLDPQPITIDRHVRPHYRTSYNLYRHPRLRHVNVSRMRRGDLIFYRKASTGRINHVALYLGNGRMVQAKGETVHATRVRQRYPGQPIARTVVRPFR
ncbi:MAG: C40 family peptidase, partial [Nocardioidaceae bacterium]